MLNEETMENDCTDSIYRYGIKKDKFLLKNKMELKK
jgi:hypothetical protein